MNWNSSRIRASRIALRAFLLTALVAVTAIALAPASNAATPAGACSVEASPSHAVRKINTPHVITVTVLRSSSTKGKGKGRGHPKCNVPYAGIAVEVRVLTGPNAGTTAVLITDANGKVVYNTTSALTGIEVTKFWAAGKHDVTRTFWIDDNGGPGPYGEHHQGVRFQQVDQNSGAMYVSTRCVSRNFTLEPAFYGGLFVTGSMKIDGREVKTTMSDTDSYTVNVKRLRKGHKHRITVTGEFATGNNVVLKATVKRCGR